MNEPELITKEQARGIIGGWVLDGWKRDAHEWRKRAESRLAAMHWIMLIRLTPKEVRRP